MKKRIEELLLGWKAFFLDFRQPFQSPNCEHSCFLPWYTIRRAEEVVRGGPPTSTIQRQGAVERAGRGSYVRIVAGYEVSVFFPPTRRFSFEGEGTEINYVGIIRLILLASYRFPFSLYLCRGRGRIVLYHLGDWAVRDCVRGSSTDQN